MIHLRIHNVPLEFADYEHIAEFVKALEIAAFEHKMKLLITAYIDKADAIYLNIHPRRKCESACCGGMCGGNILLKITVKQALYVLHTMQVAGDTTMCDWNEERKVLKI